MARQLRLRLIASEDSDIPKNLNNIIVSIHAIATFQALHDYLRPRVAGLMSRGSRLSNMLAALASSSAMAGSSSTGTIEPPKPPVPEGELSGAGISRRRSQRLRAKKSGAFNDDTTEPDDTTGTSQPAQNPSATGSLEVLARESAPSDTVVNDDEFTAEFTDEDVDLDAEVCDALWDAHTVYSFCAGH